MVGWYEYAYMYNDCGIERCLNIANELGNGYDGILPFARGTRSVSNIFSSEIFWDKVIDRYNAADVMFEGLFEKQIYVDAGWDIADASDTSNTTSKWVIEEGVTTPYLRWLGKTEEVLKTTLQEKRNSDDWVGLENKITDNKYTIYSSYYSSTQQPYMAFDKEDSKYWCSKIYDSNCYIGYKYIQKTNIKEAVIGNGNFSYGTNERCKKIKLQCSNDMNNWTDASEEVNLGDDNEKYTIKNTKVDEGYYYWRIYVVECYGSYASSYEINFYD